MICPKCGFQQTDGRGECPRCGVIISKYHAASVLPSPQGERSSGRTILQSVIRFYKVFRWVTLGVLVIVLVLILRPSKPPEIAIPPDAAQVAEEKVQRFQSAAAGGAASSLKLDQPELNAWLSSNLALKGSNGPLSGQNQGSITELAKIATGGRAIDTATVQQAQSSVRDVKVELKADQIHLYAAIDLYGKDMSMELEGRLFVQEGYLRLDPTAGKFGSLPLLSGTLSAAADRLFTSPENKEKFRLPPYIQDVRIENSCLIVTTR